MDSNSKEPVLNKKIAVVLVLCLFLSSFLIEILFITTLGIGLGIFVGFTAGYGIWYTTMKDLDIPFSFPWITLGQIIGAVYLAAIIFTIIPAYKASKIPPAEAIRHIG